MRTFHTGGVATADDITQGLPRVEEIFEARKPKGLAVITEFSGSVEIKTDGKKTEAIISGEDGEIEKYLIPFGSKRKVETGDFVEAGDTLTEGSINPHDILKIKGVKGVQAYMLREFRLFTAARALKFPISTSKLSFARCSARFRSKIRATRILLPGELIDIFKFEQTNDSVVAVGGVPATAKRKLLGITKASLATDSFLSAASFQETTRVLTEACNQGQG